MCDGYLDAIKAYLSFSIKYVLMYTRTHLTQRNEPGILHCSGIIALSSHFVLHEFFIYYLNWMHVVSKMATSSS